MFEVTLQEQGIEVYNMMREALYIGQEKDEVEKQIDKIDNVANTRLDANLNRYGLIIAFVALVFSLVGSLTDQYDFICDSYAYYFRQGQL
ncbi:MAG: hypothetical protein LUE12_07040 [Ruminococcus sp.]|nr:hypothetical protein [Ruminococcus sp.]